MKFVRHVVVFALVAQISGLPWLGLQLVSKTIQTYRNAQQNGVAAAIQQMPKGKGNCGMCKKIKLAKAQQDQQQRAQGATHQWNSVSALALLPETVRLYPVTHDEGSLGTALCLPPSRLESPPTPPPRLTPVG